jgi:hypothetical protein
VRMTYTVYDCNVCRLYLSSCSLVALRLCRWLLCTCVTVTLGMFMFMFMRITFRLLIPIANQWPFGENVTFTAKFVHGLNGFNSVSVST